MYTRRTFVSCGCTQLYNLGTVSKAQLMLRLTPSYAWWHTRGEGPDGEGDGKIYKGETVIFSDADCLGNGKRLEGLIKDYKLGEVVKVSGRNPNTEENITTYLWRYNGNKIRRIRLNKTVAKKTVRRSKK